MRFIRKRSFGTHTIMRSDLLRVGVVQLFRHRVPPMGVDPYEFDFNQHDDRNYSDTDAWSLHIGRLTMNWRSRDPELKDKVG